MAFHRLTAQSVAGYVVTFVTIALLTGCGTLLKPPASPRPAVETAMIPESGKKDPFIRDSVKEMKEVPTASVPQPPDYQPVSDDVSPAKSRLINIQSRNSTLGDILHVIADAANLNLIIGEGVQQDRPITITLRRVSAEEALTTVLNSADYFYSIKDNVLSVEATGTKLFELGHPAMIQGYTVDVGGDILGSGAALTASGSGGSGGGGSSNIKGTISQSVKSDSKAFDFWEGLEKSLQSMIGGQVETVIKQSDSSSQSRSSSPNITSDGLKAGKVTETTEKMVFPQQSGNKPQQLIIVNRLTGTIMVTATRSNLMRAENYLNMLRMTLNRQVLVEARIIEVQLNDSLKYGIDWGSVGGGQITGGFGQNLTGNLQAIANSAAPNFRIGAISNSNQGSVAALLTALKTQGEVKTLSNPRINVMNGQTALLTVGRNQNYIAKVTSTSTSSGAGSTTTFTVDTANVLSGIMIGLAPIINSKGEISLTVTPIVSELVSLEDKKVGSDPLNQTAISIPTVDLRELSTTVKVHTGELIVIGGLISNKQNFNDEKVPILGDIPWIKGLFTRKNNLESRSELVVVLQPNIISDK